MKKTKSSHNRTPEEKLAQDIAEMHHDPYKWVLYSFPWGEEGELEKFTGPDIWQTEVLKHIRDELKKRKSKDAIDTAIRIALSAGNGPGKSALVAWIILWGISTFEDTRGVVTANTDNQLRIKTWAELSKWYRLCLCKDWFNLTATSIYSKDKEHERTWRIDQVPWSEEKSEAFAGLHNKGKRIILIFDESSAIPDKIWETAEGALTDKDTEIIWLVSGNPTRNTGRFRECWGKFRHRWQCWQIDIRNSMLVNLEEVRQWISDLGIDSDWVRVHVLGQFPKASDLQFISTDIVEAAATRKIGEHEYFYASKVIGVDPAWTGGDEIVIGLRQGLAFKILQVFQRNDDDSIIAAAVARFEDTEGADAVFIDQGYGTGIYSFGKTLNRQWILVNFGSASNTPGYANKRAEIWGKTKQWLKEGGSIPNDPKMIADLIAPEYKINLQDNIVLESKESMRKRGLASPGRGDALALTFSFPVIAKIKNDRQRYLRPMPQREFATSNYDPLALKR